MVISSFNEDIKHYTPIENHSKNPHHHNDAEEHKYVIAMDLLTSWLVGIEL